jgi:hypothetical protein
MPAALSIILIPNTDRISELVVGGYFVAAKAL